MIIVLSPFFPNLNQFKGTIDFHSRHVVGVLLLVSSCCDQTARPTNSSSFFGSFPAVMVDWRCASLVSTVASLRVHFSCFSWRVRGFFILCLFSAQPTTFSFSSSAAPLVCLCWIVWMFKAPSPAAES